MRTLVIETAGAACSIALFDGETLCAARHELVGRGHAERLIPWIAELPDGGRADHIIVGCGPGSFTGVRIGIAAARALALGWNARIDGVSSLSLIAAGITLDARFLVAVEGGHGEIFVQPFDGDMAIPCGDLASLTPQVAAQRYSETHIFGSGSARLVAARGCGEAHERDADARHCTKLGSDIAWLPPRPLYGRAPDAKPAAA